MKTLIEQLEDEKRAMEQLALLRARDMYECIMHEDTSEKAKEAAKEFEIYRTSAHRFYQQAEALKRVKAEQTDPKIFTANGTQYTTIVGPDGAEYIITLDAAIKWAQPLTEPPSLEFTLPDVQDPKP